MAFPGVPIISQAANALSNLALITPSVNFGYQPFNPLTGSITGASWLFHYEGENKVKLEAEATDSWLEDNTAVQDHIVVKPEIITVRGHIGECVYILPPILAVGQQVLNVLTNIGVFSPSVSASAQNAINQVNQGFNEIAAVGNTAIAAWNSLTGNGGPNQVTAYGESVAANQNNQQAMFSKIYGYWRSQVSQTAPNLFQVQTPWAVFDECALIGCEVTQGEDTQDMSEFMLTFKMMRLVNENAVSLAQAGRAATLGYPPVNNGTVAPYTAPDVLTQLAGLF